MKKNLLNKKRKSKAFTLIELIIVIAIIAILAAVAVPKLLKVKDNSNVKADIAVAKNIKTAIETAVAEDEDFTKETDGSIIFNFPTTGDAENNASKLNNYLDKTTLAAKAKNYKGKAFKAVITTTNEVKVYVVDSSDIEILPNPATGTCYAK